MRLERLAMLLVLVPVVALADPPSVRVTRFERDRGRQDERAFARALRAHGLDVGPNGDVVVEGEVSGRTLTLRVRVDGSRETLSVEGDSPRDRGGRGADALAALLVPAAPASSPEAAPEEYETESGADAIATTERTTETARGEDEAHTDAIESSRGALSALSLELTGGVLRRRLAFRDDLFGTVSNYALPAAPTVGVTFAWFPGAHASSSHVLSGIGVAGDFRALVRTDSASYTGESFRTRSMSASVDALYRVPVGAHSLSGRAGYGSESFLIEPSMPATPGGRNGPRVPRIIYRYVRVAGDADLRVAGPLRFGGHAGVRFLVDAGELDDWFPDRRGMGFELGLSLLLAFDVVTLRAYADYVRYAFAFRPDPGDTLVVGGASDDWLTFGIAIGLRARAAR